MTTEERIQIALDLLGMKDQVNESGEITHGSNSERESSSVFHYLPEILDKYSLSPKEAKNILLLMQGAFSPKDRKELIEPICGILDGMPELKGEDNNKLEWVASPAAISFIIKELVDREYIKPPLQPGGDINYRQLARQILGSFTGNIGKEATLANNMSPDNEHGMKEKSSNKFKIPHYREIAKSN